MLSFTKKQLWAGSVQECAGKCEEETEFVCRYSCRGCSWAEMFPLETLLFGNEKFAWGFINENSI